MIRNRWEGVKVRRRLQSVPWEEWSTISFGSRTFSWFTRWFPCDVWVSRRPRKRAISSACMLISSAWTAFSTDKTFAILAHSCASAPVHTFPSTRFPSAGLGVAAVADKEGKKLKLPSQGHRRKRVKKKKEKTTFVHVLNNASELHNRTVVGLNLEVEIHTAYRLC